MPKFDNTFRNLPAFLYEDVRPTPISHPKLMHVSKLAEDLDLGLTNEELTAWLNGEKTLPGEQRISTRYAGHQFGVWAGQLGDGRAISLGEIQTPNIGRQEIQTKGSGLTPFSRRGDGKAVIRSSVREYLCSEAMNGLGIPTTRVLALITGDDPVYRETVERSAIVARVFPSNIRFGHFEMCFHFEKDEELKALIDYTRTTFYPGHSVEEMLKEIITRTAKLMAHWQNVGFCHGVMNTDNMSILGLTIDYGPFGFLEDTILNYICNHSDHYGRYAYNQQPSIGMWNLERLLVCFLKEVPKEKLQELLNEYPMIFEMEYQRLSREKLGLYKEEEKDFELFIELLNTLNKLSVDYTFFFRTLAEGNLQKIWDYYGNREELKDWNQRYQERLSREEFSNDERTLRMKKTNPKYVLKNYIAQEIIEDVEAGSSKKLEEWLNVLYAPFDEHPEFESYAGPTPPSKKNFEVSCSS
ncbi:protein adenylyltransferase SelO [Peredibacter sp. HCB2-198]|uniref:protein adenylyltransferase SelO n=1 Tax=Peredibacter sp. HCB2-198 TaxID=3383025 RepID=UPI0038B53ED9